MPRILPDGVQADNVTIDTPAILPFFVLCRYLLLMKNIYAFAVRDIDGRERALSEFAGKVLLIVNVASKCGFTPQYKTLQTLYTRFKERGFEILAFPANDFGRQEPGTEAEIKSFCSLTYGVTFPLFSKISVKGKGVHPIYAFLTDKATNPQFSGKITWNFNKFLLDRKGNVVARFDSKDDPMGDKIPRAVSEVLDR
ncbi:MAG: glutathione peroxidase [Spirochaetia bacterium]